MANLVPLKDGRNTWGHFCCKLVNLSECIGKDDCKTRLETATISDILYYLAKEI